MEPRLVDRSDFHVVGIQVHVAGESSAIPDLWRAVIGRAAEVEGKLEDGSYGATLNFNQATREFDYVAGFGVPHPGPLPEGMTAVRIPAGLYAQLTCTLPTMMDTLHQALHEWMPASGYEHTGTPEVERYPPEFDPSNPESEFSYFIPLAVR